MVLLAYDLAQILQYNWCFLNISECQTVSNEASISLLFSKHPSFSVLLSLSWLLLKMKMSPRKEHAQSVLNKRFWNIWPVRNKDLKGWELISPDSHTTAVPQNSVLLPLDSKQSTLYVRHKKIISADFKVILCFKIFMSLLGMLASKTGFVTTINCPDFQSLLP